MRTPDSFEPSTNIRTLQLRLLVPLLMFIITISYLSSGLYIPSLPIIEHVFGVSADLAKLTQASYFLGLCLSQLVYGPLSDAYGRRSLLLVGLSCLILGAALGIAASDIQLLIWSRFIQGVGAGAGLSLTRATLRDCYQNADLARVASYFTINAFVFASSAPLLGSIILLALGWRWIFGVLLVMSFVACVIVVMRLPETNRYQDVELIALSRLRHNAVVILTDPTFLHYSLCAFCAFCALMAWMTVSPMLIQKHYGLTPIQFGVLFLLIGVVNAIGGVANSRLTGRIKLPQLIQIGLLIGVVGAVMLLLCHLIGFTPLWTVIVTVMVFLFGFTFIFANAFALAFSHFEKNAGLASAAFAFFQVLGGVLGSVLMAISPDHTSLPYAVLLLTSCLVPLLILRLSHES